MKKIIALSILLVPMFSQADSVSSPQLTEQNVILKQILAELTLMNQQPGNFKIEPGSPVCIYAGKAYSEGAVLANNPSFKCIDANGDLHDKTKKYDMRWQRIPEKKRTLIR